MEERQKNKGYLTEKVVPPEVIYSHGSVASPSTLQGTFSVNGYDFHIDGWHTVNEQGHLYVSILAYVSSKKVSVSKKKFTGYMEEMPMSEEEGARVCDRQHPVPMQGVLKINDIEYAITGRAFITQTEGISIEFLIFAPKKK